MVTLVPADFFNPAAAREALAEVAEIGESEIVKYVSLPQFGAVLIYSITGGEDENSLPELFYLLRDIESCTEYNRIFASYRDGLLNLVIAQGKSLLLANEFKARDFTTAEYFIFLSMKSLQLNPEVSTICWRTPLSAEDEMSLYRYFKGVEQL